MVIASLYPVVETRYESNSVFNWGFIRELQRDFGEPPHDYHVFLPHGCQSPDPISIGRNISVKSVMELSYFFQEFHVDIWHDFGYTNASDLVSLRHLSGQNYPITVKVELPFLSNAQLTTYSVLSENDALICSRPSTRKLIEAVHNQLRESAMQGRTSPQIRTIPHGVKPEQIDSDKKQDARYLLSLPEEITIILCSVDFNLNSGTDIFPLIRAFQTIAKNKEDLLLIISGSDEYSFLDGVRKFLEGSALGRQVLFLPNAGESARLILLAASDIFISPSDTVYTDNGLQVLEAMARGIPVIATDDDENGYIDHGRTGFKVKKGCLPLSYQALRNCFTFTPHRVQSLIVSQGIVIDVQQIIEFLVLLIEDVSLRQTIGAAAMQYVCEHHNPTKIVEKYEHLWSNLHQESSLIQLQTSVTENQTSDDGWLPLLLSLISQTVHENTPLHITSEGQALLETQDVVIYEEMEEVIFPPIILTILDLARSVTCLSEIIQSLIQLSNPEETKNLVPNIAYHIMWCIKQGLMIPHKSSPIVEN